MIGKKADSFDAESDITRQQICMVLSRMEGEELSHMAEAFAWGVENELLEADRPGEAATVREMVTMLWKWFGEPEVEPGEQEASPDAGALTHEEQMAMAWAVEMGIVEDASASGDTLARGAFAQVLYRSFGD